MHCAVLDERFPVYGNIHDNRECRSIQFLYDMFQDFDQHHVMDLASKQYPLFGGEDNHRLRPSDTYEKEKFHSCNLAFARTMILKLESDSDQPFMCL